MVSFFIVLIVLYFFPTVQAEDLQAGSSYGVPGLTQQTYGSLRASDEIIDEGHFIGKVSCANKFILTAHVIFMFMLGKVSFQLKLHSICYTFALLKLGYWRSNEWVPPNRRVDEYEFWHLWNG